MQINQSHTYIFYFSWCLYNSRRNTLLCTSNSSKQLFKKKKEKEKKTPQNKSKELKNELIKTVND